MGARPRALTPDRSARDLYGAEVRRLRTKANLSLAQLAEKLTYSKTHLGNFETAERMVPPGLSERLDAVLDTDGLFTRLYPHVRREGFRPRYRRYMELEERAEKIEEYATQSCPGCCRHPRTHAPSYAWGIPEPVRRRSRTSWRRGSVVRNGC